MSDLTVTEREAVQRERKAFAAGADWCASELSRPRHLSKDRLFTEEAADHYPLPRVTRPREVKDEYGFEWRMMQNNVEWRPQGSRQWSEKLTDQGYSLTITRGRATLIADLLANPTETVPDGE